jgi:ubiquinone biosynthesis protein
MRDLFLVAEEDERLDRRPAKKGRRGIPRRLSPTPLADPESKQPLEIHPVRPPSPFRGLHLCQDLGRFLTTLVRMRFSDDSSAKDAATAAREFFESLGGVWLKVGQLLSLRTDLFRQEFCDHLSKLHERARAFPAEDAIPEIEAAAGGRPIEEVFSEFDEVPVAAASFAQVFRARLAKEDVEVAVKVQKPWSAEIFRHDMKWITALFRTLDFLGIGRNFQWNDMLRELNEMIADELDYRFELSSLRKMRPILREHGVYTPRPFPDYCGEKVLVMEYVRGTSIAELIRVRREDPGRVEAWMEENHISPEKVAQNLLSTTFRQIFEDNISHGDLHPGNVMLLRGGRIALLDFGNVATFDPAFMSLYGQYLEALNSGKYARAADLMLMISAPLPALQLNKVRTRLFAAMRKWDREAQLPGTGIHQKSLSASSSEIGKIAVEYKFRTNWSMLKLGRAFSTLDMSMGAVHPQLNYPRLMRRYFKDAVKRRFWKRLSELAQLPMQVHDWIALAEPSIRRAMMEFEGAKTEIGAIITVVMRALKHLVFAVAALVAFAFLHQAGLLPDGLRDHAQGLVDAEPWSRIEHWVLTFLLTVWVEMVLFRLVRQLEYVQSSKNK